MTDFEALYFALNKLDEIKTTTNEWEISVIQSAIMTHIEEQTKKDEAAMERQKKFDEAMKDSNRILNEMLEIAERGLRA